MNTNEDQQRQYYAETAAIYEETHVHANDEHSLALCYMMALMRLHGIKTVLDVGCGTGRAVRTLHKNGFEVIGLEPVQALIDEGYKKGVPEGLMMQGDGSSLPFPDGHFDAVCEFGVLHHVRKPETVVKEMLRVCKTGIFLSDTNRFGRDSTRARIVKLLLWKTGLWPAMYYLHTCGKNCDISDCDGIAYSYSVYDQYSLIDSWADQIIAIPTKVEGKPICSWLHPLMTSSHVLLCGLKNLNPEELVTACEGDFYAGE